MENRNLVFIILVSVIIVVIASMAVPVLEKSSQPAGGQAGPVQPGQQAPPPAGKEEAKQLKTAISFINLALIIPLLVIYAGIFRKMQSSFTLGLLAVIFALGMYAVTSNPMVVGSLGGRIGDIGLFQIIPDLCATAALLILVRISLE